MLQSVNCVADAVPESDRQSKKIECAFFCQVWSVTAKTAFVLIRLLESKAGTGM